MDIRDATKSYEAWLQDCTEVVESELTWKHSQMRDDLFMFFRGTYYRWTQLFSEVCKDLRSAPRVLAVGDLHVGSYGTWRDREGRLCWGVDDFDDSYPLPYANDLVRLATSVKLLTDSSDLILNTAKVAKRFWKDTKRRLKRVAVRSFLPSTKLIWSDWVLRD